MLYRRTEMSCQDGASVYGRLIAKQQPSLLGNLVLTTGLKT